jgi:microcystin-dependent protein
MGNLSALANNVVQTTPVGVIEAFAGVNVPAGWLFCDGSAISRIQYPELFSALSTTYGSGDGSTTFNLPDLRGRVPAGKDNMGGVAANRLTSGNSGIAATSLGANGGDERLHQHTHAQNAHSHSVESPGGHSWGANFGGLSGGATFTFSPAAIFAGVYGGQNLTAMGVTATNQNTGSGNSQNVQPTLIVNYIIKAVADLPRGGWFYQNQPPVVTQLPSNPQIGEEVYLYTIYGYIGYRWDGSSWITTADSRNISFIAHGNTSANYQGSTNGFYNFLFTSTTVNNGNGYNTSNGRFTAPVTGLYNLSLNVRLDSTPAGGYLRCYVWRPDGGVDAWSAPNLHAIFGNNHATDYQTMSVSGLMYLTAGQYVNAGGGHISGASNLLRGESTFTGHLVK